MTAIERIRAITDKWIPIFGLSEWRINIELVPARDDLPPADDSLDSVAECCAYWQYETAVIRFAEEAVDEADDRQLERDVIHELLHCVLATWRERSGHVKFEEQAVVYLTRAFQRVAA